MRAYLRQRERLLDTAASDIQHMQKAMTEMNLQLHHVVSDIIGATGMRIIRAIIAGERDPTALASMRDTRCHSSAAVIEKALTRHYRTEHLFVVEQALALYDVYQKKVAACVQIESVLNQLNSVRGRGRRSGRLVRDRRGERAGNRMVPPSMLAKRSFPSLEKI